MLNYGLQFEFVVKVCLYSVKIVEGQTWCWYMLIVDYFRGRNGEIRRSSNGGYRKSRGSHTAHREMNHREHDVDIERTQNGGVTFGGVGRLTHMDDDVVNRISGRGTLRARSSRNAWWHLPNAHHKMAVEQSSLNCKSSTTRVPHHTQSQLQLQLKII